MHETTMKTLENCIYRKEPKNFMINYCTIKFTKKIYSESKRIKENQLI